MLAHAAGKVALVTGGAAGTGAAYGTGLAQDGFDIVIVDLNDAGAAAAAVRAEGRAALAVTCDVRSAESVAALAKTALNEMGHVDVLVNNAGVYPATAFLDMRMDEWQQVMNVNVDAPFHTVKAFLSGKVDRGWGRIINMSATTFHSGIGFNTRYTASKGAVIGFTRKPAAEVGEHEMTVNAIAPVPVRTATTSAGPQAHMFEVLATTGHQANPGTVRPRRRLLVPGIGRLRGHHRPDPVRRRRQGPRLNTGRSTPNCGMLRRTKGRQADERTDWVSGTGSHTCCPAWSARFAGPCWD